MAASIIKPKIRKKRLETKVDRQLKRMGNVKW